MASEAPRSEQPAESEKSVGSPSNPRHAAKTTKPASSSIGRSKTEAPAVPPSVHDAVRVSRDDVVPIGNKKFELSLRLQGKLGLFMKRDQTAKPEVDVPIDAGKFRAAVARVVNHVLLEAQRSKHELSDTASETRINRITEVLADGVAVLAYLKLRAINLYRPATGDFFLTRPKVPAHFEVPLPFAYAISQLGIVEVSSLPKRMTVIPTAIQGEATRHFLPEGRNWSQSVYAEAVHYAKSLGLSFNTVDLDVKVGSAWWLFKQNSNTPGFFSLTCPLPEDNYTEAAAVVHTLFCNNDTGGLSNEIFDVTSLGTDDYGSFIRNPRDDISFSSYYAITGSLGEEPWKSAD